MAKKSDKTKTTKRKVIETPKGKVIETQCTVIVLPDRIKIIKTEQGLLGEIVSIQEKLISGIPKDGLVIEALSVNFAKTKTPVPVKKLKPKKKEIKPVIELEKKEVPEIKPRVDTEKKKEEPKKKRTAPKKIINVSEATYVGPAHDALSNKSAQPIYEKERSYYLREKPDKPTLVYLLSKAKYGKILSLLKSLNLLPADYEAVKQALIKKANLKDKTYNSWLLVAMAKKDIIPEIKSNRTIFDLGKKTK